MDLHTRKGTMADLDRMLEIERSAIPAPSGQYLYENRHFFFDGIQNRGEMVLACDETGYPVGMGQYSVLPDGSGWLETLRVEREYQRQGVGKAIYKRYMELARETGAPSLAMFTGRKNLASKGLAEKYGFHLAAAIHQFDLDLSAVNAVIVPGFHPVPDEEEAVALLTRTVEKDPWGPFMGLNRTFLHYGEPLYRYLHREGMVYTDGESVVVLGARMLRHRGLNVGYMAGDLDKCLRFAASATAAQGMGKLTLFAPYEREDIAAAAKKAGFGEPVELIVMEWEAVRGENAVLMETDRLALRRLTQEDFGDLCKILQDEETMYAYEGAFSDAEVQDWLDRQLARYEKYGFGLWAVICKATGELIGQCGLTMQPWKDEEVLEIGYLFRRDCWHKGYATEAAIACREYAFHTLGAGEVCSIIRDTNLASQGVAKRNGMVPQDTWVKHYRGVDMPHIRYVVKNSR